MLTKGMSSEFSGKVDLSPIEDPCSERTFIAFWFKFRVIFSCPSCFLSSLLASGFVVSYCWRFCFIWRSLADKTGSLWDYSWFWLFLFGTSCILPRERYEQSCSSETVIKSTKFGFWSYRNPAYTIFSPLGCLYEQRSWNFCLESDNCGSCGPFYWSIF